MIENSMYESSVEMPRVPRSMSRVTPPVCRSRWKRSDSACRCWNTCSATRRMARFATRTKTMSRNSANSVVDSRSSPYMPSSASGSTRICCFASSESTIPFMTSGTPTFASFAITRNVSATATRHL